MTVIPKLDQIAYANITSWSNTNITVNSQLNLKANITDSDNYYTKTESDNIIIKL